MGRVPMMNNWLSCLTAVAVLTVSMVSNAAAAEVEPYDARVVTPGAGVHSGPGDTFYTTETLPQGEVVEIYREEPGGWLGIRPPQDSFSWVFGSHVKRLDGSLAKIDKDDVASRIGSRLGNQKNAVQVRLRKGEVVEIIGEANLEGKKWYKIAPPSGEFRWIHVRNVERPGTNGALDSAVQIDLATRPIVTVPISQSAVTEPTDREQVPKLATQSSDVTLVNDSQPQSDREWRAAPAETIDPPIAPVGPPEGNVAVQSASDGGTTSAPVTADKSTQASTPTTTAPAAEIEPSTSPATQELPITPIPGDDLDRQLSDIELRLSRMVAEPPATWQIDSLRRDVEQLMEQSASEVDRTAMKSTLAKFDRFAVIAQRYQQANQARSALSSPMSPRSSDTRHLTPDTSRYDAVGILHPVVSKRAGAPQFALVDERGQVVSFVTPSPDMNLQPYVGHRIGVTGNRGFIPEFQRSHVTAGRVAPLGGRVVR